MKMNTKLGGKNGVISGPLPRVSAPRTIICDADVTHPSPMDKTKTRPSTAAVTASVDPNFIRHASAIHAQGYRERQIMNFGSSVDLSKNLEGQCHMVLNHERGWSVLEVDYFSPITFFIVQKRHNTRLFPDYPKDADRSGNVKVGTVVDSSICLSIENDFYLNSYAGLQGTNRTMCFTADELQAFTYKLCYTFARCTRSVSMVPSTYYSHLMPFQPFHAFSGGWQRH
ncbi:Protein argonaute 1A [Phytophthora ramorum]|uniref:Protein argonaute 1A n=1 Tax=Phytophthora ramorum TaxID=164328 RepID=UPI0030AD1895|nr:Protein argonaute 1A [Phytophthora ramorum]